MITEIPSEKKDLYYYFEIEEWIELDKPIKRGSFKLRDILYTTEYLLKNSHYIHELCIKSKEEYRVWKELRRIVDKNKSLNESENNKNITSFEEFKVGNKEIIVSDNIIIKDGENIIEYSFDDLRKKSREVIKQCLKRSLR